MTATWRDELIAMVADPAWQAQTSEQITREIHETVPELRDDPGLMDATLASTADNARMFALVVAGELDASDDRLPPMAAAYARTMVRRGVSAGAVLRVYRVAHEVAWRTLLPVLKQRLGASPAFPDALEYTADVLLRFINAVSEAMRREYERESERTRSSTSHVARTVALILEGSESDTAWISRRLRYSVDRGQIALVAWPAAATWDAADDPAASRRRLDGLLGAVDAASRIVVDLPGGVTAAWVHPPAANPEGWTLDPSVVERAGLRVALGTPRWGLAGFRRSHREAVEARRVATAGAPVVAAVTRYADVVAVALATAHEDDARAFVERQLGPLLAANVATARLRDTLLAFLEHRGRSSAAADELGVHVNTVINRVRAAERLLPATAGPRTSDTALALRIAARLDATER